MALPTGQVYPQERGIGQRVSVSVDSSLEKEICFVFHRGGLLGGGGLTQGLEHFHTFVLQLLLQPHYVS
jgi:hypothetical protein